MPPKPPWGSGASSSFFPIEAKPSRTAHEMPTPNPRMEGECGQISQLPICKLHMTKAGPCPLRSLTFPFPVKC